MSEKFFRFAEFAKTPLLAVVGVLDVVTIAYGFYGMATDMFGDSFRPVLIVAAAVLVLIYLVLEGCASHKMTSLASRYRDKLIASYIRETKQLDDMANDDSVGEDEYVLEVLKSCQRLMDVLKASADAMLGAEADTRACIKQFCKEDSQYLFTYCRSLTDVKYSLSVEHLNAIPILGNTDFEDIYLYGKRRFVSGNLTRQYKRGRYSNTNGKFRYNSAAVYPICSLGDEFHEGEVDTLGFLCVDSEKRHLFSGERGERYMGLQAMLAGFLYVLLSDSEGSGRRKREKEAPPRGGGAGEGKANGTRGNGKRRSPARQRRGEAPAGARNQIRYVGRSVECCALPPDQRERVLNILNKSIYVGRDPRAK